MNNHCLNYEAFYEVNYDMRWIRISNPIMQTRYMLISIALSNITDFNPDSELNPLEYCPYLVERGGNTFIIIARSCIIMYL